MRSFSAPRNLYHPTYKQPKEGDEKTSQEIMIKNQNNPKGFRIV